MRKSNTIIAVIAVVAAVFLLWLWYFLGFNRVDYPLDLVLTIIWLVIVAVVVIVVHRREKIRQELVRRVFVTKNTGILYNSEAGVVSYAKPTALQTIEGILTDLDYKSMDIEDRPDDFQTDYIVRTSDFETEKETDEDTGEDKKVITDWEGELYNYKTEESQEFKTKDELSTLLSQALGINAPGAATTASTPA